MNKQEAIKALAENIQWQLDKRRWSLRELSRRSDVSPMALCRLLNRESMVGGDACYRIAKALGVSLDLLFVPRKKH